MQGLGVNPRSKLFPSQCLHAPSCFGSAVQYVHTTHVKQQFCYAELHCKIYWTQCNLNLHGAKLASCCIMSACRPPLFEYDRTQHSNSTLLHAPAGASLLPSSYRVCYVGGCVNEYHTGIATAERTSSGHTLEPPPLALRCA